MLLRCARPAGRVVYQSSSKRSFSISGLGQNSPDFKIAVNGPPAIQNKCSALVLCGLRPRSVLPVCGPDPTAESNDDSSGRERRASRHRATGRGDICRAEEKSSGSCSCADERRMWVCHPYCSRGSLGPHRAVFLRALRVDAASRARIARPRFSPASDEPYSISMGDSGADNRVKRVVLVEKTASSGTLSAIRRHALEEKATAPHCGDPCGSMRIGKRENA